MGFNQASFYGDNLGSTNTGEQYGPYNLGTCNKLLHVSAFLNITYPAASFAAGSLLEPGIEWGVQWVAHGASPLTLPGNAFEAGFLWVDTVGAGNASTFTWAPSTDTAEVATLALSTHDWWGQLVIGEDIDLYLTTAYSISVSTAFGGAFQMRVTNTD